MTTGLSRSSDPSTSHGADQMAKTFDSRCYDLAAVFLGDEPALHSEARMNELAALIQTTTEDYIATELGNTQPG